jgi:hypothetical protein
LQLLIDLAVLAFLVRSRRQQLNSDRNVAGTRLKVTDRRRPRNLDRQVPRRRRPGVGAIRDRGEGENTNNKRHRAHDRPPWLESGMTFLRIAIPL